MPTEINFSSLENETFINLTTFKSSGDEMSTPVWFTSNEQTIYVFTDLTSYKVKRIKHNPAALLAASKYDGTETGPRLKVTPDCYRLKNQPTQLLPLKRNTQFNSGSLT
ncbi:MAG: pyridoxamine 5'-phosphate oxidase family protein [Chloroflexota bacterium]